MSTSNLDFKPCPHEILFFQLSQLGFNKFLECESKKRSMAFLKSITFNGYSYLNCLLFSNISHECFFKFFFFLLFFTSSLYSDMFRKPNKFAFQAVAYFITIKVAQLTKKTKWVETIKFPSISHEEEAAFRRNFTDLVESIEKDPAFSTVRLPAMRAQLLQCHGDQLVLLFSKVISYILLRQMPKAAKDKILQITLPNVPCHYSNTHFIALAKESISNYEKVKGELNQEMSYALEDSHALKSAFAQAKSDYDKLKKQVENLESERKKMSFGDDEEKEGKDEEKVHEYMVQLSCQVSKKQESIKLLMDDEISVTSLTPDSLTSGDLFLDTDTFSLLDTWKNLLTVKNKLDEQLKSSKFYFLLTCNLKLTNLLYEWLFTHNISLLPLNLLLTLLFLLIFLLLFLNSSFTRAVASIKGKST